MARLGRGQAFGPNAILGSAAASLSRLSWEGADQAGDSFSTTQWIAQPFIPGQAFTVTTVQLMLGGAGVSTRVDIYSNGTNGKPGASLANATVSSLGAPTWTPFTLSVPVALQAGTTYWIVVRAASGSGQWEATNVGAGSLVSTDSGATWTGKPSRQFLYRLDASGVLPGAQYAVGPRPPQAVGATIPFYPTVTTLSVNTSADLLRRHLVAVNRYRNSSKLRGPVVVTPPPSLQQQTITVVRAVDLLVGRNKRLFPPQWYEGSETDITAGGIRPDPTSIIVYSERALGPDPPTLLTAPPPVVTTIDVTLTSAYRRNTEKRRFPLQGWIGWTCEVGRQEPPLLDDFKIAPETPLSNGGRWAQLDTSANVLTATGTDVTFAGTGDALTYWTNDIGADVDVSISNSGSGTVYALARLSGVGTATWNGYRAQVSGTVYTLSRVDNGVPTTLATATLAGAAAGIGIRCVGSTIIVWSRRVVSGRPQHLPVLSFTDATYASGFIGFGIHGVGVTVHASSFFGNNAVAGTPLSFVDNLPAGCFARLLGPRPPLLLNDSPLLRQQIVLVTPGPAFATENRRAMQQRFPLQGWASWGIPPPIDDPTYQPPHLVKRNLGPWPPLTLENPTPSAPPVVTTIMVAQQAVAARQTMTRRMPLQGWNEVTSTVLGGTPLTLSRPPASPYVDQFSRADSSSLGAPWVGPGLSLGAATMGIASLKAVLNAPASDVAGYWRNDILYSDTEVGLTIAGFTGPGTPPQIVYARIGGDPTTNNWSGYALALNSATAIGFYRHDFGGSYTALGGSLDTGNTFQVGDKIALRVIGSTLEGWVNQGGAGWVLVGTQTDSRYKAGYVGMAIQAADSAAAIDDFFAGGVTLSSLTLVQPFLGPRRPLLISSVAPVVVVEVVATAQAIVRSSRPRRTTYKLFGFIPQVSAQPPPPVTVELTHARPRHTISRLSPPTVLQTFAGPRVTLVRTRPRPVAPQFVRPATLEPESVSLAERTIRVQLVRTRPRHTLGTRLGYVVYPATSVIQTHLVRTRSRSLIRYVAAPATLEPESVQIAERTIRTVLVRTRPRHTQGTRLGYVVYPATSEIGVTLVRARPRPTTRHLAPPTTLQTFAGPVETQVAVRIPLEDRRPAPPSKLFPPATLEPFEVQLLERTIRTPLVRTRPRPTTHRIAPPTVLQTFAAGTPHLVRTRPRPTTRLLAPPATLEPESIQIAEREIRVLLVRARPRPTARRLAPPSVVRVPSVEQLEQTIRVTLTRTRPRPTTRRYLAPVTYPATSEIQVTLARIRPRPTVVRVAPPTVLQTFRAAVAPLVRTRPRPTTYRVFPPTVIRVPTVEQREETITVALVRTRPRPTVHRYVAPVTYPATSEISVTLTRIRPRPTTRQLAAPTVLQTFAGPQVTLARTRPRPTVHRVAPPTVVRVPSVEQQQRTIRTALVQTRPRPTTKRILPPRVVRVPSVEQAEQTIRVTLVQTRPSPTTRKLQPPRVVVVNPPVVTTLLPAHLVQTRPRPTRKFLRPPTVVIPLPTLRMQTVSVALTRTRPRPTIHRLTAIRYAATSEIQVTLVRTPRQRTQHRLTAVTYAATGQVQVTLVRIRPRPTAHRVGAPTVLRTFAAATAPLTRIRPPRTHSFLAPPATLEPAVVELAERTIRVVLTRTRPRPTTRRIVPPTVVRQATFTAARTPFVRIRPVAPHSLLRPPTVVATFVARPIEITLARTRPRRTVALLEPPATLRRAPATVTPTRQLARTPRQRTHSFLAPPTVVEPTPLPAQDQRTIRVWLADQPRVALIRRAPHFRLPPVVPPPAPVAFAQITDLPVAAGEIGDEGGPAVAAISDEPVAAAELADEEAAAGHLNTIPGAAAELSDEHGGL